MTYGHDLRRAFGNGNITCFLALLFLSFSCVTAVLVLCAGTVRCGAYWCKWCRSWQVAAPYLSSVRGFVPILFVNSCLHTPSKSIKIGRPTFVPPPALYHLSRRAPIHASNTLHHIQRAVHCNVAAACRVHTRGCILFLYIFATTVL